MTPTEVLMQQIDSMSEARDKLQKAIDDLTGSIDPDDANWKDVSQFAHVADAARGFLERFN